MSQTCISTNATYRRTRAGNARPAVGQQRTHATPSRLFETGVLVAIAILLLVGLVVTSHQNTAAGHTERIKVESGQTLWDLAESHPVRGLSTAQTAELIGRLNHLSSSTIVAHDTLIVPAAPVAEHTAMASR